MKIKMVSMRLVCYWSCIVIFVEFFHFGTHERWLTWVLFSHLRLHLDSLSGEVNIYVVYFLQKVFFELIKLSLSQLAHIDSLAGGLVTARMATFCLAQVIRSGIAMRISSICWRWLWGINVAVCNFVIGAVLILQHMLRMYIERNVDVEGLLLTMIFIFLHGSPVNYCLILNKYN